MALCLEGSVIFTPHGKNQCGNPVNITNVLIWANTKCIHAYGEITLGEFATLGHFETL